MFEPIVSINMESFKLPSISDEPLLRFIWFDFVNKQNIDTENKRYQTIYKYPMCEAEPR